MYKVNNPLLCFNNGLFLIRYEVGKEIIIRGGDKVVDIALLEDSKLMEFISSSNEINYAVGDIYLAKIQKVRPSLNAVFVELGYEHAAFLHYNDLGPQFLSLHTTLKNIIAGKPVPPFEELQLLPDINKSGSVSDILQVGDYILVQVAKEPISTKGPKLCSEISLAGRNIILLPFSNKISISQKIESNDERNRLRKITKDLIPKNYGAIVRTAANGCEVSVIEEEIRSLVSKWENILKAIKIGRDKTPYLVQREVDRVSSLLRDVYSPSYTDIIVENKELFEEVREYISLIAPEQINTIRLYSAGPPIFEQYGIERQIKSSFGKVVPIRQGAYLVIEHTEALHVIDVNSGIRSKNKEQEQNTFDVNCYAAEEIARQLRLRDMGGIVIVDFIDMDTNEHRNALYKKMQELMESDRAKHNVLPLTKFGLMQITRQRVRPATEINTMEVCPVCNGTGKISSSVVIDEAIERRLSYYVTEKKITSLILKVNPILGAYLTKGLFSSIVGKWKKKYKCKIEVVETTDFSVLQNEFYDEKGGKLD